MEGVREEGREGVREGYGGSDGWRERDMEGVRERGKEGWRNGREGSFHKSGNILKLNSHARSILC